MAQLDGIQQVLKDFILREFLEGEDPERLDETTELYSSGILDSLGTLKLITFLEERFGVPISAHETDEVNFRTIASIGALVRSKK